MRKYEVCLEVWNEYVIEVEASSEEEAEEIAKSSYNTKGKNSDGNTEIRYCFEMEDEEEEE